jgi:hypothetical protein
VEAVTHIEDTGVLEGVWLVYGVRRVKHSGDCLLSLSLCRRGVQDMLRIMFLYAFFWVIHWHLWFKCQYFGTH